MVKCGKGISDFNTLRNTKFCVNAAPIIGRPGRRFFLTAIAVEKV